ncbi:MFS general substrate transporter [Penicillium taxi]|uniref:MFS general substrate transporter n=1 Tax=Penicillium taxi TaxID=168475 RepID=UPI0025455DAA|nr:MFS general substrate transporter [Penicillium taxi]KAJ5885103.1 MFS general substrate transporter [Penicillium taxi]
METPRSQGAGPAADPDQSKEAPPIKECPPSETDSSINLMEDDSHRLNLCLPISTSMTAPALTTIAQDLHIHHAFEQMMSLSIFLLAYAFGPLFSAPMSEVYGRRIILQGFNLIYLAFNTACGFAQTGPQLIVCRFFAGFGGSAASVIASGILGDLWRKEERGLSVSIYTMVTLMGPTLGPLLGGFITYRPTTQGDQQHLSSDQMGGRGPEPTQEAVLTLYISYLFGLVYLALATFAEIWTTEYYQSISIASLNYLGLTVDTAQPEFRLPLLLPGALMVPIGLLWYDWSAQHHLHWIMPGIGIALFAIGVKYGTQCTQLYALDVYPTYAASASAGAQS